MKFLQLTFIISIALSIHACATVKSTTVKETDVAGPTVIQKPVVADLDVKETKVSGTYSCSGSQSVGFAKDMALADALKNAKADVLIEPRYDVSKSFRKIEVTVTGYPATYKNFRPMEAQDTLFLNSTTPSSGKTIFEKTGNGRNKRIALIATGAGVLAAGAAWFFIFVW